MQLFEGLEPETIRNRILANLGTSLQTREGSFIYDIVSPVSFEIWRLMMTLNELISAFYVDEYSGPYLDLHAELLAMSRRQGTKAAAVINFIGKEGLQLPAGTAFYTGDGLQFNLMYDITLLDGTGTGYLQAAEVGAAYNVDAGTITKLFKNIPGLTSFTNEGAVGGADPETDAALFSRIEYKRQNPATSGNENQYKEWALECEGIGDAKVTGLWNGPGTIRVLVVDYNYRAVEDEVLSVCNEYIQARRLVGADVTVVTAAEVALSISATIVTDGTDKEKIRLALVSELDTYLQTASKTYFQMSDITEYTLYYNKIASILMNIPGVVDYSELLINGASENIVIESSSVCVLGEVEIL